MCCLRRRRLGRCCARSTRAAPASTLARVTVLRGAAHVLPQAVAAWLSPRSLSAGCSGFYAGARHNVARCCTCAASGSGGLAVAALARRWLRRLLRWCASRCDSKVPRVPPQAAAAWPLLRSFSASCAGFYAGARHGVARGGTCATSGGGGLAVAAPARRGLRRLLRWRASRCGARRHVCHLRRRRLGRRCARSARAAPASTLARVTVWRGAAHVLPHAAVAWPSLRSLGAGCAGFNAGARHGVAQSSTCAGSGGWLSRCCARSSWAALASTLARITVWREVTRVPPQVATAWLSLNSLGAGCAGSWAGARHGVARGGTCATSGGDGLAVAALARRGLRQLLRWRASRCGAR